MSTSISNDEDWSIISSSSDFEDESTTTSSVRDETEIGDITPSDSLPDTFSVDQVDESLCTIREAQKEPETSDLIFEEITKESSDYFEPTTPGNFGVNNDAGNFWIVRVVTFVACVFYSIDRFFKGFSRRGYERVFSKKLATLKTETGAVDFSLCQHAMFSAFLTLERHQDYLLYYLMTLVAGSLSLSYYISLTPQKEETLSDKVRELWVAALYEKDGQRSGFVAKLFTQEDSKKLRTTKYWVVVRKEAPVFWKNAKLSSRKSVDDFVLATKYWSHLALEQTTTWKTDFLSKWPASKEVLASAADRYHQYMAEAFESSELRLAPIAKSMYHNGEKFWNKSTVWYQGLSHKFSIMASRMSLECAKSAQFSWKNANKYSKESWKCASRSAEISRRQLEQLRNNWAEYQRNFDKHGITGLKKRFDDLSRAVYKSSRPARERVYKYTKCH